MKTVYTIKKIGSERLCYAVGASRFAVTRWLVDSAGQSSKSGTFPASPTFREGIFGYLSIIDGSQVFFPSDKDATDKRHVVFPA